MTSGWPFSASLNVVKPVLHTGVNVPVAYLVTASAWVTGVDE